jgi:Ca2+-binding RTX toxin-like protein
VIVEMASEGVDLVQSSVSHTLAANVEQLTLTGSSALTGTGNDLANVIKGNSGDNLLSGLGGGDQIFGFGGLDRLVGGDGADTLNGGSGNDTLIGGGGVDLLIGEAGRDRFVLERGMSQDDRIQDFAKGDVIELRGFAAGSTLTKLSAQDWVIRDAATGTTETFHVLNGYSLRGGDYLFT